MVLEPTLIEQAKKILEHKKACLYCGFNYGGRVAILKTDCIASKCNLLKNEIKIWKPYYETKMKLIREREEK